MDGILYIRQHKQVVAGKQGDFAWQRKEKHNG